MVARKQGCSLAFEVLERIINEVIMAKAPIGRLRVLEGHVLASVGTAAPATDVGSPAVLPDRPSVLGASVAERRTRRELFRDQGFVFPVRILDGASSDLHQRVVRGFEELEASEGLLPGNRTIEVARKTYASLANRHFEFPWFWDLITAPEVLDVVEDLIGPDIMLMNTNVICKYGTAVEGEDAAAPGFIDWHQDVTYWGLEDDEDVLTVWYAVDPSTK